MVANSLILYHDNKVPSLQFLNTVLDQQRRFVVHEDYSKRQIFIDETY